MLSHVAWLSEEYLRTSREKVNIAQTVHDSVCVMHASIVSEEASHLDHQVDRHIRLLDQFIKEQEALLGPEPNRPVMLSMSDLFVPKWSRSTRVSMSPVFDEEEHMVTDGQQAEAAVPSDRSNRRRSLKSRRHKEKEKEKEEPPAPVPLRITLPPPHHGMLDDPNEPTWCYCNRVSFGEVSTRMSPNHDIS
jgi:hypothetical protein